MTITKEEINAVIEKTDQDVMKDLLKLNDLWNEMSKYYKELEQLKNIAKTLKQSCIVVSVSAHEAERRIEGAMNALNYSHTPFQE